jgi:serine/threonine protein kinase
MMHLSRTRRARTPTAEDNGEKLASPAGLSLGESPRGERDCGRASLFRLAPPSFATAHKMRDHTDSGSGSGSGASSPASSVVSGARRLMLPHTITERHGGRELWVKAPVVCGELDKRGFRWRRKWKTRYVELDGRQLAYYDADGGSSSHAGKRGRQPRRRVRLAASGSLEDLDALSFSVVPAQGEPAWVLRARDAATKLRWCRALSDCLDILAWLQHYAMGAVLGVGGNGVVQELVDTRDQSKFAVKMIDVAKFRNRDAVVAEVEILRNITNSIRHPNLIAIHKVYEEHGKVYIIQELCTGGELYDAVIHRGRYSERDAADIMRQLLSALRALHKHNILHLDLKPENILLADADRDHARIKLTDFGLARMINGKQNPLENGATSMAGTVGYMAPEVITSHLYSEAADVFSAGVILYILLVGYPPFHGDSEVETLLKIARGDLQFDPEDWAGVSMPAKRLVARMLEVRAQDRISVDDALAHPWIAQLDEQTEAAAADATASETVSAASNADAADNMLDKAVERLQRFNFDRKSENMGSLMGSLLLLGEAETLDADYNTLLDTSTIGTMIRQLSPDGRDRIPLDRAHIMARGLGLSPFVDVHSFVAFLDRNHDGFIDAGDFCEGVRAMRSHDKSFATVIFAALCKMVGLAPSPSSRLNKSHFKTALDQLECPEPLQKVFFKHVDEQEAAAAANGVQWSADQSAIAGLMDQFSFLGLLFLRTARENVVSIVRSRSVDDMPRISEGSLSLSP